MKFIYLILLLFISNCIIGQDKYEFIGTVQLIDKSLMTYKISFTEEKNGTIVGKSITDFTGAHRTESKIEGKLNRENKSISFREVANTSTKSSYPDSTFCYIHLPNAKIKFKRKKNVIQGHFYSYYNSGEICVEGDIYLIGEEQYFKKANKLTRRAEIVAGKNKVKKARVALENTKTALKEISLRDKESITFFTSLDSITLMLVDTEYEDGDMVDIHINDEIFASKVEVKNKAKFLKAPLVNNTSTVKISAVNEGRIPPNSAKIQIVEFEEDIPLIVRLNKGGSVSLVFKKT